MNNSHYAIEVDDEEILLPNSKVPKYPSGKVKNQVYEILKDV